MFFLFQTWKKKTKHLPLFHLFFSFSVSVITCAVFKYVFKGKKKYRWKPIFF